MSYASSERDFYLHHYQGGIELQDHVDLTDVRQTWFAPGRRYHLALEAIAALPRHGTLVEIGCADGRTTTFLAQQFRFQRTIGIDIAFPPDTVRTLNGVEFVQANSNEPLPLEPGSVDVFLAMMVIEHLFDPFHAFKDIARVLSPGGMAIVNLPLVTSLKNRARLLMGELPVTSVGFDRWFDDREWDGNHLHYFSIGAIRRLLDRCGLRMTRLACVGSHHRLKALLPSLLASELTFVVEHR